MLQRILTSLAITSLIIALVALVFWQRSFHHSDHFSLGSNDFNSLNGGVMVTVAQSLHNDVIQRRTDRYSYHQILGAALVIPALWLAIWLRSLLPKPPGKTRQSDHLPPLDSSRR